jgi:hypothetical protein
MDKIVIHTVAVTKPKQKIHFDILLPENASLLTGIEVSTNRQLILAHKKKYPHRAVGVLRLFVADDGDCIFSQMLHADHSIPKWEATGEPFAATLWNQLEMLPPFLTKQFTKATLVNGFYEDMVGDVIVANPNYTVKITLYYQI